jgi:hypothetical protein
MVQVPTFLMGNNIIPSFYQSGQGVSNALAGLTKARQFDQQMGMKQQQFNANNALAQGQFGLQKQAAERAAAEAARAAQSREGIQNWLASGGNGLDGVPRPLIDMARIQGDADPVRDFIIAEAKRKASTSAPKIMEVNGEIYRVPNDGDAVRVGGISAGNQRAAQAAALGLDPSGPEYMSFMANGKLPAAYYEQASQKRLRAESAPKIEAGLRNMAAMADRYDDASFTNSVGPFQGSTPDSLIGAAGVNTARFGGEILNRVQGGKTAPTEIRSNIQGSTEALAAAIKPLIRGPGEGVWTDQDQARLVAVVGDLATASTKEEYRRRLNDVRDRLKSNFDLNINFDALPKQTGRLAPGQSTPGPSQQPAGALPRVNSVQEAMKLPKGTRFIDPNGDLREVP